MRTKLLSRLPLVGLAIALLAAPIARAEDNASVSAAFESEVDGLAGLLRAVGGLQLPNLSGLIQPERMGLLTDNQCRIHDNEAHLLASNDISGNETELSLLSENKIRMQAGASLLSGITINVHVTIQNRDSRPSKAKPSERQRKPKKSKRRGAGRPS